MLDADGEEYDVAEKDFDTAISRGLTPALEMVGPDGEEVLVKRPDLDAALSKGYEYKVVAESKKKAAEMPGDTIPAYAVPGYGAAETATYGLAGDVKGAQSALSGGSYSKGREQFEQSRKTAQKESPWLYALGQGLGIAATAGTGAAAASRLPMLNTVPGLVGQGAATAGANAYGTGEGSVSERLSKAPEAAMYGAGANAVLFGGGAALKGVTRKLFGSPEELAYRSTGAMEANKKMLGTKKPEQVGQSLLEEGVIGKIPRSKETLSERASARIGSIEDLNDKMVIDTAKSGGTVSTKDIVTELGDKTNRFANQLPTSNTQTARAIQRERQAILDKYGIRDIDTDEVVFVSDMSPREAVELKRSYSKPKNYVAPGVSVDSRKIAEQETASSIRGQILKDMEGKLGSEQAGQYALNNQRQGNLISANNILEDQIRRDKNRKKVSLTDWLAMGAAAGGMTGAGAYAGGLPGAGLGISIYVGKKLAEAFGPQIGAKIGYEYSKLAREKGYKLARDEIARRFGSSAGQILLQQEQQ